MKLLTSLLFPLILIASVSLMYFISIDLSSFNRADAAMILMTLLAGFNLYTASKWYRVGFITFQKLKEQEKTATSIINKLTKKLDPEAAKEAIESVIEEELDDIMKRVKAINQSTKD